MEAPRPHTERGTIARKPNHITNTTKPRKATAPHKPGPGIARKRGTRVRENATPKNARAKNMGGTLVYVCSQGWKIFFVMG